MRTELAISFAASLVVNAGMLASFEHAVSGQRGDAAEAQRQRVTRAKEDASALNFEFVEAPPVSVQKVSASTDRISDRDALNQDRTPDKTLADSQSAPRSEEPGRSDQLAQTQSQTPSAFSSASPAVPERPAMLSQEEMPPPREDETTLEENPRPEETQKQVRQEPSPAVAPSPASPAREGSSASGRINTPPSFKTQSHGAQFYGVTSFEATGSGMGAYMKNLKERIWMAWFPYLLTHYPKDFQTADAVVNIVLNAQGDVKIVELFDSQGSPLFAAFCMESVQRAGPFGPVPQEILALIGKDEIEIKFAFHYW